MDEATFSQDVGVACTFRLHRAHICSLTPAARSTSAPECSYCLYSYFRGQACGDTFFSSRTGLPSCNLEPQRKVSNSKGWCCSCPDEELRLAVTCTVDIISLRHRQLAGLSCSWQQLQLASSSLWHWCNRWVHLSGTSGTLRLQAQCQPGQ